MKNIIAGLETVLSDKEKRFSLIYKLFPVLGSELVNFYFVLYVWLAQPRILLRVESILKNDRPDIGLALFLFLLPIFEFAGLLLKRPVMAYHTTFFRRQDSQGWPVVLLILSSILHLSISCLLFLVVFSLTGFGQGEEGRQVFGFLQVVLVFLVITREAFFIVMAMPYGIIPPPADTPFARKFARFENFLRGKPAEKTGLKEISLALLGDLLLWFYYAPIYTVLWGYLTYEFSFGRQALLSQSFGMGFYFVIIYLGTRTVQILYENFVQLSTAQRRVSLIGFLISLAAAILTASGLL